MYSDCGSLDDATAVFEWSFRPDVCTWTTVIAAYTRHGKLECAFATWSKMHQEGLRSNEITFLTVLDACSSLEVLETGKHVHRLALGSGLDFSLRMENSLISMYGKCSSLGDARDVFDRMRYRRNVITWTAMVAGHAQCEDLAGGIYLCREMMLEGVRPQSVTFAGLLDGCRGREAVAVGASIHGYVRLGGMESDSAVNNALVNMYSKSGGLEDAVKVFNDQRQDMKTSSWASVIAAYVQHGLKREATELYHHLDLQGMEADENVFASVLGFCDSATQVRDVHSRILASGLEQRMVAANAVMTAYGKAGHPDEAREVFLRISRPSVISWSALIAAYGQHREAIKTFELMNLEGVKPNATTLTSVLRACATVGAHEQGRRIHALVLAGPYAQNTTVLNAAASLYAKCSRVADASRVFSSIPCKDAVSWNAIVSAYAKQGLFRDAIFLSRQMQVEGFVPDDITFITILYSCSQSGQLAAACECLSSMVCDFGMVPAREHYVCLIDVLGRAGRVGDAVELKDCMPYEADAVALESLRAASRIIQNG